MSLNIHRAALAPLTNKNFQEIIEITQSISESFDTLPEKTKNQFINKIPKYFLNFPIQNQEKMDNNLWDCFDQSFSKIILKDIFEKNKIQNSRNIKETWLKEIYQIESLAASLFKNMTHFTSISQDLQPIVIIHEKKNSSLDENEQETITTEFNKHLIARSQLTGPVFESTLKQGRFQEGITGELIFSLSQESFDIIFDFLKGGNKYKTDITNKNLIEIFNFANEKQLPLLLNGCIEIINKNISQIPITTMLTDNDQNSEYTVGQIWIPTSQDKEITSLLFKASQIIEVQPLSEQTSCVAHILEAFWYTEMTNALEYDLQSPIPPTKLLNILQNLDDYLQKVQSSHSSLKKNDELKLNKIGSITKFIAMLFIALEKISTSVDNKCNKILNKTFSLAFELTAGSSLTSDCSYLQARFRGALRQQLKQYDRAVGYHLHDTAYYLPEGPHNAELLLCAIGSFLEKNPNTYYPKLANLDRKILSAYIIYKLKEKTGPILTDVPEATQSYSFSDLLPKILEYLQPIEITSPLQFLFSNVYRDQRIHATLMQMIDHCLHNLPQEIKMADLLNNFVQLNSKNERSAQFEYLLGLLLDSHLATTLRLHPDLARTAVCIDSNRLYWNESLDLYTLDEEWGASESFENENTNFSTPTQASFRSYLQNSTSREQYFKRLQSLGACFKTWNLGQLVNELWIPTYFRYIGDEEKMGTSLRELFTYFLFPESVVDYSYLPKKIIFGLTQSWGVVYDTETRKDTEVSEAFIEAHRKVLEGLITTRKQAALEANNLELVNQLNAFECTIVDGKDRPHPRNEYTILPKNR